MPLSFTPRARMSVPAGISKSMKVFLRQTVGIVPHHQHDELA
jgi:hypothetical protein